jgi:hypothetical protein
MEFATIKYMHTYKTITQPEERNNGACGML